MKCLSLVQPWASLIAVGAKRVETRSWSTPHRGLLAIHASAGKPKYAREFCDYRNIVELLERYGLDWESLPRGAVVATSMLVDCVRFEPYTLDLLLSSGYVQGNTRDAYETPASEYLLGDFDAGRYGFVLDRVQALYEPIPAKGALGLWEFDPEGTLQLGMHSIN